MFRPTNVQHTSEQVKVWDSSVRCDTSDNIPPQPGCIAHEADATSAG